MKTFCVVAPVRTPNALIAVNTAMAAAAIARTGSSPAGQRSEIVGERYAGRRHAAALRDEQQRPSEHERQRGMKGVAHIGVESAVVRTAGGEFGEDARAEQRDRSARHPDRHHQQRRFRRSARRPTGS